MKYEERRRQVLELREQGLTQRAVAEQLGISHGHVKHVCSDRSYATSLRLSREAKQRRTGTCIDCGAATRYNGTTAPVSRRCVQCGLAYSAEMTRARRGTGKVGARVLEFISEPKRYSEIRDHLGISSVHTGVILNRLVGYGLATRLSRGVYVRSEA